MAHTRTQDVVNCCPNRLQASDAQHRSALHCSCWCYLLLGYRLLYSQGKETTVCRQRCTYQPTIDMEITCYSGRESRATPSPVMYTLQAAAALQQLRAPLPVSSCDNV